MDALWLRGVPPTSKGSSRRHSAVFACTQDEPRARASIQTLSCGVNTTPTHAPPNCALGGSWKTTAIFRRYFSRTFWSAPFSQSRSFGEGCSPAVDGGTSLARGARKEAKDTNKSRCGADRTASLWQFPFAPVDGAALAVTWLRARAQAASAQGRTCVTDRRRMRTRRFQGNEAVRRLAVGRSGHTSSRRVVPYVAGSSAAVTASP